MNMYKQFTWNCEDEEDLSTSLFESLVGEIGLPAIDD